MIALAVAIVSLILLPLAIFSLQYVRMTGANQQQRTALEAAALAAASDLSAMVIEDPYFGFIGLSDAAPIGTATKAGDNYFLPVKSINTVIATARIDMIIADLMNSSVMKKAAARDYALAMTAKDRLVTALSQAIAPTATVSDIFGKTLSPYNDALKAYQSNPINVDGRPSSMVAGSLKLTLGFEDDLYTTAVVPEPASAAYITPSQTRGGYYRADTDLPYDNCHFVLAGVGSEIALTDFRQFKTEKGSLPYLIPSVVSCQADQIYEDRSPQGKPMKHTIHSMACARTASLGDQSPCPGALFLDFRDGNMNTFADLRALLSSPQVLKCPSDFLYTAPDSDSPPGTFVQTDAGLFTDKHPRFGDLIALGMYDWFRRGGTRVNIAQLVSMLGQPFDTTMTGTPHYDMFAFDKSGNIVHTASTLRNVYTTCVSNDQLYGRSGVPVILNTGNTVQLYDMWIKDYCFQPGRIRGGLHAGEPLLLDGPLWQKAPPVGIGRQIDEQGNWDSTMFPTGPAGGAVRETYTKTGIALDIMFRARAPEVLP